MKFLGALGIDWKLLIAQIVNFGILVWLLSKFLYRPLIARIERDEAKLRKAEEGEEKLASDREVFEREREQALDEAKKRSKEIIDEAEDIANGIRKRAKEETDEEKHAVIEQLHDRLAELEHETAKKTSTH